MSWHSGEVSAVSWQQENINLKDLFQTCTPPQRSSEKTTLTNAVWQGVACVVLPVGVDATSRTVAPLFSLVEPIKGLSRGTGVFHPSLKCIMRAFQLEVDYFYT